MKIVENEEFLIVDTEDKFKPFSRVYVFMKDRNIVELYGISEIEDNLYSPFEDDWEKRVAELCKARGII